MLIISETGDGFDPPGNSPGKKRLVVVACDWCKLVHVKRIRHDPRPKRMQLAMEITLRRWIHFVEDDQPVNIATNVTAENIISVIAQMNRLHTGRSFQRETNVHTAIVSYVLLPVPVVSAALAPITLGARR